MAMLYGWSLPSLLDSDHTYVTSSDNYTWNCWGRSSGGVLICAGEGNSLLADCLSQNKSQAGIIYGITGVCHQTANRILLPAQCSVLKARKYWLSVFLYGSYGTKKVPSLLEWDYRRHHCSLLTSHAQPPVPQPRPTRQDNSAEHLEEEKNYLKKVGVLYQEAIQVYRTSSQELDEKEEEVKILNKELELMADFRLGLASIAAVLPRLFNLQRGLLEGKRELDQALLLNTLSPKHYSNKVQDLLDATFHRISVVLGEELFKGLFGLRPDESLALIDPEILATSRAL